MAESDPSGAFLFVPCRVPNYVAQYRIDATTGKLTRNEPFAVPAAAPGAGPRHIAFHPTRPWAYVINELDGTTTSYQLDPAKGTLSAGETIRNTPEDVREVWSAHVVVHPSGRFVYGSNRTSGTISIFAVDQATGRLTRVATEDGGGAIKEPRNFTIDPAGRHLVVVNQAAPFQVIVFTIDGTTGKLTKRATTPTDGSLTFAGVVPLP